MPRKSGGDALIETVMLKDRVALDIGSGDGSMVRFMAKHGAHVTGIECGPLQLEKARAATPVADENYVEGVGQALPQPEGSVDLVTFINSLHHVPVGEQGKALAEAARVLKDGGDLYIAEPLAYGPQFELVKPIDDETEVRAAAYAQIGRAAAYGLEALREFTFDQPRRIDRFEDFRDTIIAIDPARRSKVMAMESALRADFERLAVALPDGGYELMQPVRVNYLTRKPR